VVELLAETIRSSVTEPLAAVGYSLGGRLLMGLAARHPALFSSLTIISAFPGYLSEADRSARAAADNEWNQRLRELPVREFLSQWYKQPIFASSSWSPDFTAAVLRSREESLRRPHDFARMLEVTSASRMPSYWEFLRTSLIPITYVAGERDHRYCQVAADIRANNPKIRTRIIENAGHLVINEKAREVSMVLRDSLG
jgi:2-succinyl-6-hydroxy-2,4-cyclohexadiene-1-carboxylate synthase